MYFVLKSQHILSHLKLSISRQRVDFDSVIGMYCTVLAYGVRSTGYTVSIEQNAERNVHSAAAKNDPVTCYVGSTYAYPPL